MGNVDDPLNPVHVGGEGCDNDPLVTVLKLPAKALCHHLLRGSIALPLHVGGVAQKGQNPLFAQLAKPTQINHAILGHGVNFKVAGHDYRSNRRFNGKGHSVCDGVVDMDKPTLKQPCLDHIAGIVGNQFDLVARPCSSSFSLMRPSVKRVP